MSTLDLHTMRMLVIMSRPTAVPESLQTLAEIDFLVRYPRVLIRALESRGLPNLQSDTLDTRLRRTIEEQVPRLKHTRDIGRWGGVFGSLVGRGLIAPYRGALRPTEDGERAAAAVGVQPSWGQIAKRADSSWALANASMASLTSEIEAALPRTYIEDGT